MAGAFSLWYIVTLFSTGYFQNISVHQFPPKQRAVEGSHVILNCSFQTDDPMPSVGHSSWRHGSPDNGRRVSNISAMWLGRVSEVELEQFQSQIASLQIRAVKKSDSGIYYCEVEFMQHGRQTGAGTKLEIIDPQDTLSPVYQHPLNIFAEEGESSEIICSCYGSEKCSLTGLSLIHMSTRMSVSPHTGSFQGRVKIDPVISYNNASEIRVQFINLEFTDTGNYACQVLHDSLRIRSDNVTQMTVRGYRMDMMDTDCNEEKLWIIIRIVLTLGLLVISVIITYRLLCEPQ